MSDINSFRRSGSEDSRRNSMSEGNAKFAHSKIHGLPETEKKVALAKTLLPTPCLWFTYSRGGWSICQSADPVSADHSRHFRQNREHFSGTGNDRAGIKSTRSK